LAGGDMAFFLPWFVQKRLLRYALTRIDLLDLDSVDLDGLGFRWGQKSSMQLQDIDLKVEVCRSRTLSFWVIY
jgi:autophagy-related protein 2